MVGVSVRGTGTTTAQLVIITVAPSYSPQHQVLWQVLHFTAPVVQHLTPCCVSAVVQLSPAHLPVKHTAKHTRLSSNR